MEKQKLLALTECLLVMPVLQAARVGFGRLAVLAVPSLSAKMETMCAMLMLFPLIVLYIVLRRTVIPVFPKRFSLFYIIITSVTAILFITAPSNFTVGIVAVVEMIYGSIITPVFEETVFRGYMWERMTAVFGNKKEKTVYLITTVFFTVWHLGYMYPQLLSGNIPAVLTKLAAACVYGIVLGYARMKAKNIYLPILIHGVMNLFMI